MAIFTTGCVCSCTHTVTGVGFSTQSQRQLLNNKANHFKVLHYSVSYPPMGHKLSDFTSRDGGMMRKSEK